MCEVSKIVAVYNHTAMKRSISLLRNMDNKIAIIIAFMYAIGCFAIPSKEIPKSRKGLSPYLLNGTDAPPGSHPYMVALTLGSDRDYVCGGSLLSRRTILTAAHCIEAVYENGVLDKNLGITVGTNRWSSGGRTYPIDRNITHPHYDGTLFKNDLGLVFTTEDVLLTDLVKTIELALDEIPGDVMTKVVGWGSDGIHENSPEILQELKLPTIGGEKCVEDVRQAAKDLDKPYNTVDPHIEICTYAAKGTGTCGGDSGSPLTRLSDGRQIGIVSWGFPCARGAPDMFVRISSFAEWIRENMV